VGREDRDKRAAPDRLAAMFRNGPRTPGPELLVEPARRARPKSARAALQASPLATKRIAKEDGGPMSIDVETARRVAKLARIRVEEADLPALAGEFNTILGFIEQLNEVDVTGVEPMVSVTPMRLKRRADGVTDGDMQARSSPMRPMRGKGSLRCRRWSNERTERS
jgi:aspartyl-tRNA(Asn)/glutamyl-tRNA(Gln) amidotransferase subunit C